MSVSPADFELYSRVTGTPLPRTPQDRMRLAPTVQNFIRQQGYAQKPNLLEGTLSNAAKLALLGGIGAGGYYLGRRNPLDDDNLQETATPTPPPTTPAAPARAGRAPFTPSGGGPAELGTEGTVKRVTPSNDPYEYWDSPPQKEVTNQTTGAELGRGEEQQQQLLNSATVAEAETTPAAGTSSGSVLLDQADDLVNVVENTPGRIQKVGASPIETLGSIRSLWAPGGAITPGGGQAYQGGGGRLSPVDRIQVDESEWKSGAWSVEDTERSIFNPTGKRLVKNPVVVGKNPDGSPKYMQPKAALTGGDRSLIPRQFPPAGRVNVGDAYASMMSGPGMSGLGPFFDGLTAHFGPLGDIHVPGALQLANWGVPVVAGLGRKGLGDVIETADLAASGLGYVAKNLRPILQQGREDWAKGGRDWQTGLQDMRLVRDTGQRLLLAAGQKRDADLSRIGGAAKVVGQLAGKVETWAEAARKAEGYKALPGSEERLNNAIQQADLGSESSLGDSPQGSDPEQVVSDEVNVPPSRRLHNNQRVEELQGTLARSMAHKTPEERDALVEEMIGEGTEGRRQIREQAQRDAGGAGPVSFAKKWAQGLLGRDAEGTAFIEEDSSPSWGNTPLLSKDDPARSWGGNSRASEFVSVQQNPQGEWEGPATRLTPGSSRSAGYTMGEEENGSRRIDVYGRSQAEGNIGGVKEETWRVDDPTFADEIGEKMERNESFGKLFNKAIREKRVSRFDSKDK